MRTLPIALLALLSLSSQAAEPPARVEPPPPPAMVTDDAVDEPQVTITRQADQTIEEYRANGKLYMIKITPRHGVPYYLVDDRGDGRFSRFDSLDSGVRVPRWVIKSF